MLVSGRRASRSSSTTSVRVSKAGSILMNWRMCPGYHEGGDGSAASTFIFFGELDRSQVVLLRDSARDGKPVGVFRVVVRSSGSSCTAFKKNPLAACSEPLTSIEREKQNSVATSICKSSTTYLSRSRKKDPNPKRRQSLRFLSRNDRDSA